MSGSGDRPAAKGRGAALMAMLKKHQEETKTVGLELEAEKVPPRARGRAALLQKLQERKEVKVGISDDPVKGPSKMEAELKREIAEVTKAAEELSISDEPKHYRGTTGRPVRATANYIKLNVEADRGVFEYEVRFVPEVDARSNRIKLVNEHLGLLAQTKVYDGSFCLYLPLKAFEGVKEFEGVMPNTDVKVSTRFIFKKKKRLCDCLHLYNVLFKRIMHVLLYTQMGRNYFSPEHKYIVPQHKLEIFPGYAVAVDEMEDGLMVCMDTQHRVIRSQTVYELLHELLASNPRDFKSFACENVIGTCILTKYNNKTYVIDDIAWEMTPKDTFPTRTGGTTTFVEYYKQHYNIQIRDVDQPMLINRRSKHVQGEKVEQMLCLVPELSYLTGLTDAMRSDFRVMKDVAAYTRITPNQRMVALRTYIDKVNQSEMAQKILSAWGLKMAGGTIDIHARQLDSETIFFGEGRTANGVDWNRAVGENKVTGPIDIIRWVLFYTQRDTKFAQNFAQTICRLGKPMGCVIRDPKVIMLQDDRTESYMNACKNNLTPDVQVAVFICPTLRADRYAVIKKMCCLQQPLASQVILSKTLSNPQKVRGIIQKIALQITCKLGGTLWTIKIPFQGWLICGIDVYHGSKTSSVCGFVASINNSLTRWYSEAVFQAGELGDFFKIAFRKSLECSKQFLGDYPTKIVIFRDGVGNGQLEHVRRYEIAQFREVLQEMNINATITFVVVQKRINTRIFAIEGGGGDSYVNPGAGTVVDTDITRRDMYDFYLVPQSVRQGTVNPTHYIVLEDDANLRPDHVQKLAYKLCHLYYNWPGTIRVPAPCLYAHKLASLVGQVIKKCPSGELSDKLYYL